MKTIIMDTSNKYLVVALYRDEQCLEYYEEKGNNKSSEYALLYLSELLKRHHIELLEIDEMVITIGPGSYTGVRVALTIAKILASVSNVRLKIVSSLKAYAGMKKAVSVIDARSNKVFVGVYNNGEDIIDEQLMLIDDFENFYQDYLDYEVVGDVELVNKETVKQMLYQNMFELSKKIEACEDVDNIVPHYIKDVEAKKIC